MSLLAAQFDSHYFWQHLLHPESFFLRAIWTTVYVAVLGQAFGTLLGLPIAMARRSTNRLLVAFEARVAEEGAHMAEFWTDDLRAEGLLGAMGWQRVIQRAGYIGRDMWTLMEKRFEAETA